MQLTLGTPINVGHHWRTKCALSGYQGGEGNGLAPIACVEGGVEGVGEFVAEAVTGSASEAVTTEGDPLVFCGNASVLFDAEGWLFVKFVGTSSWELVLMMGEIAG